MCKQKTAKPSTLRGTSTGLLTIYFVLFIDNSHLLLCNSGKVDTGNMSAPKTDTVILYVNGEEHQIANADPEWTLAHYLRDHCEYIFVHINH